MGGDAGCIGESARIITWPKSFGRSPGGAEMVGAAAETLGATPAVGAASMGSPLAAVSSASSSLASPGSAQCRLSFILSFGEKLTD